MRKEKIFKFALIQDGQVVASSESSNREAAVKEIAHYAFMYSEDGPVRIKEIDGKTGEKGNG